MKTQTTAATQQTPSLVAIHPILAIADQATKSTRARRPAGLGYPTAKKLVNPQHTLELKKSAIEKSGGLMVWAKKFWAIKNAAGAEFVIESRKMASLSVAALMEYVA